MTAPKVFIVILNWNRAKDSQECIESVLSNNYTGYRIIFVDNGSTEKASLELASKYPGIIFVKNEQNMGYSGGNNAGIRTAYDMGANYVFLLTNDTVVEKNFLTELMKVAEKDKSIGALGPLNLSYSQPGRVLFGGGRIKWLIGKAYQNYSIPEKPEESDYLDGCAIMLTREVLEKTEWFDTRFFTYFEETDWCVRIRKAGFKVVLVPSSRIRHKQSITTGGINSPLALYYGTRNRLLFMKKNVSLPFFFFFVIFIFPGTIVKNLWRWHSVEKEKTYFLRGIKDFILGRFGKYAYSD